MCASGYGAAIIPGSGARKYWKNPDSAVGKPSIHVQAAIHVEHFARDEAGERGGKEFNRVTELLGLAEAADGNARERLAALGFVHLFERGGILHEGGRDRVHGDAVRR